MLLELQRLVHLLQHEAHVVAPSVLTSAGLVVRAGERFPRAVLVADVRHRAAELLPGLVVVLVALGGAALEGQRLGETVQLGEVATDLALGRRVGRVLGGELEEQLLALGLAVLDPGEAGAQRAHFAPARSRLRELRQPFATALQLSVVEVGRAAGDRGLDRIGLQGEQLVEDVLGRARVPQPVRPVQSIQPEQGGLVARRELPGEVVEVRRGALAARLDLVIGLEVHVSQGGEDVRLLAPLLGPTGFVRGDEALRGSCEIAQAPLALPAGEETPPGLLVGRLRADLEDRAGPRPRARLPQRRPERPGVLGTLSASGFLQRGHGVLRPTEGEQDAREEAGAAGLELERRRLGRARERPLGVGQRGGVRRQLEVRLGQEEAGDGLVGLLGQDLLQAADRLPSLPAPDHQRVLLELLGDHPGLFRILPRSGRGQEHHRAEDRGRDRIRATVSG